MTWPAAQRPPAHASPNPTSRPLMRRWVLGGVVILAFTLVALAFAVFFGVSFGIVATLLGAVFAIIPLGVVVPTFLWLDRFEAEPWRYLVLVFVWGALGATLFAIVLNTLGGSVIAATTDPGSADLLTAVLIAPLTEESFKGVILVVLLLSRRHEIDGITDGLVYAGITAAGFAFTENILYLARSYTEYGGEGLAATFFLRGVLSPFCHPMFTALIGVGVGIAAVTSSRLLRWSAPVGGWTLAVLAHAAWNLSASAGARGFVVAYGVGVLFFGCFLGFIVWARAREGRLIGTQLTPYVQTGWLSPGEVNMLTSISQRRTARAWARRGGGVAAARSMQAFQDAATDLAMLRRRMAVRPPDAAMRETEQMLLAALTARRRDVVGPPAQW